MRHTVLVVDDRVSILQSVTLLLKASGFDAITARSYEEACTKVDAGGFCIVLTDIGILPTVDAVKPEPEMGLALITYIRERFPERTSGGRHRLPIVVLSALETDQHREAVRRGADDFIKKPYTRARPGLRDTLLEALRSAEREHHEACATGRPNPSRATGKVLLGIPGRVTGNTADVSVNGEVVTLPNSLVAPLLTLIEARLRGDAWVPRTELGAQDAAAGWKGASNIHRELRHALAGARLIANDKAGGYRLDDGVELDAVHVNELVDGSGSTLAKRASSIASFLATRRRST